MFITNIRVCYLSEDDFVEGESDGDVDDSCSPTAHKNIEVTILMGRIQRFYISGEIWGRFHGKYQVLFR